MKWGSLLGWGVVMYALLSLTWSGRDITGLATPAVSRPVEFFVLLIVAVIAGRSLRFNSWSDILPYSIFWALTAAALDAVFAVPLQGWNVYDSGSVWIGYGLVALLPLLAPLTRHEIVERKSWEY